MLPEESLAKWTRVPHKGQVLRAFFVKKGAEKLAIIETRLGDAVLPTPDLFRGDTQAQRQVTLRQSEIEARLRQKQIGGVWSHMLVLFLCR